MFKLKPDVEFIADVPDDSIYDEDGAELQFAGQAVSQYIAEGLAKLGYKVETPENCFELGWEFAAEWGECRFWMRVGVVEHYVIATRHMADRFRSGRKSYGDFLIDLHAVLRGDPRFSRFRWFEGELPEDDGDWWPTPTAA